MSNPAAQQGGKIGIVLATVAVVILVALAFIFRGTVADACVEVREWLSALGASNVGPKPSGGWIDRLFAADAFVGFVRLVLIALGLWLFASAVRHMRYGNWIVGMNLGGISTVNQQQLDDAKEARKKLRESIAQVDQLTDANSELEAAATSAEDEVSDLKFRASQLLHLLVQNNIEIPPLDGENDIDVAPHA